MIRLVRSLLAVAYHDPSGPKATAYTKSECPVKVCSSLAGEPPAGSPIPPPVFASDTLQRRTVLSKLALASFVPSGLKLTYDTVSRCPPSELRSFQSVVS